MKHVLALCLVVILLTGCSKQAEQEGPPLNCGAQTRFFTVSTTQKSRTTFLTSWDGSGPTGQHKLEVADATPSWPNASARVGNLTYFIAAGQSKMPDSGRLVAFDSDKCTVKVTGEKVVGYNAVTADATSIYISHWTDGKSEITRLSLSGEPEANVTLGDKVATSMTLTSTGLHVLTGPPDGGAELLTFSRDLKQTASLSLSAADTPGEISPLGDSLIVSLLRGSDDESPAIQIRGGVPTPLAVNRTGIILSRTAEKDVWLLHGERSNPSLHGKVTRIHEDGKQSEFGLNYATEQIEAGDSLLTMARTEAGPMAVSYDLQTMQEQWKNDIKKAERLDGQEDIFVSGLIPPAQRRNSKP